MQPLPVCWCLTGSGRSTKAQAAAVGRVGRQIGAGSCAAGVAKRGLQGEHNDAAPDRLRCVRVAQLVRMQVHTGFLAPAAHPVGNGLPRQVAVSARRWEQPGICCAPAKGFEQRQRVGRDPDGARLRSLAEQVHLAAVFDGFEIAPAQPGQLRHTATDQIGPMQLHIVAAGGKSCSGPKSSGGGVSLPSGSGSWR